MYPNTARIYTKDFTGNADMPFDFFMSRYKEAYVQVRYDAIWCKSKRLSGRPELTEIPSERKRCRSATRL
eukprot:scaffold1247_cov251-Pinguiococcus_pyrenoidosus.AAC.29